MNHTIRTPDGTKEIHWTPGQAIKNFCWECFGFEGDPVKECASPLCPLFPARGRPKGWRGPGRVLSDSEKLSTSERLSLGKKAARERALKPSDSE